MSGIRGQARLIDPRLRIVETCRLLYSRQLTDTAGGNISVRENGLVYLTPRYIGTHYHWNIDRKDISVLDENRRIIDGPLELTREVEIHLQLYETLPAASAVIHAHPSYTLVFAAARVPIQPVTEPAEHLGTVEVADYGPAHSAELAQNVVAVLKPKEQQLEKHPIACLLPKHGIVVVGKDLDQAFDALERIEVNAKCSLFSRLLGNESSG